MSTIFENFCVRRFKTIKSEKNRYVVTVFDEKSTVFYIETLQNDPNGSEKENIKNRAKSAEFSKRFER